MPRLLALIPRPLPRCRRPGGRAKRRTLPISRRGGSDREAITATRETQRATSVHGFMVDLFAANSNDQKNAVEVRKLTAKQLLDRGTARLEAARDRRQQRR